MKMLLKLALSSQTVDNTQPLSQELKMSILSTSRKCLLFHIQKHLVFMRMLKLPPIKVLQDKSLSKFSVFNQEYLQEEENQEKMLLLKFQKELRTRLHPKLILILLLRSSQPATMSL
jgi:cell division protein FtsB